MQPNKYQRKVLKYLRDYLNLLKEYTPAEAYQVFWNNLDVQITEIKIKGKGMPRYKDAIKGVPHVCFKVPTGGGKTFLATCAVRVVKDAIVQSGEGTVVWLVPSDTILEQTLATLRNPDHPYRQQLQKDFPSGVEIYTKEQLLNGQNFQNPVSVQEHLSVLVLSFDSFRSNKKDGRRSYRENAQLSEFPISDTLPEGADETSLVNAINVLNPIVIVDESHHTTSNLSVEMLQNFNPRFILDLTATPRENSNIIAFAEAMELKRASMVKLPLIVYNRHDKHDVMQDAIQFRAKIEAQAIEEEKRSGKYIRPIVLFQAQQRGKEEATTFQKLKDELIKDGIPQEQIAIKTSIVNELKNVDLLSRDCQIRYIITVNALKEGWDCPFAYVLATLANRTSKVDVEQIVGRVLRQPYAECYEQPLLNNSFVLTCSHDFQTTVSDIVKALNSSGFDEKDLRVPNPDEVLESEVVDTQPSQQGTFAESPKEQYVEFLDDYSKAVRKALENKPSAAVENMEAQAVSTSKGYEQEIAKSEKHGILAGVVGSMKNEIMMNAEFREETELFLLPQFGFEIAPNPLVMRVNIGIIDGDKEFLKLEKDRLLDGFDIAHADSNVNFSLSSGDIYSVDVTKRGAEYTPMTSLESEYFRTQMARRTDESKRKYCAELIVKRIYKDKHGDIISRDDLETYVERAISKLSNDQLMSLQTEIPFYSGRIKRKLNTLLDVHREKIFMELVDDDEILCLPSFKLEPIITPADTHIGLAKSLYETEAAMNSTEIKVIEEIVKLDIRWWHRNTENKKYSFCINGFINHYPDFIVMTNKGNLVVVEVKGDDRDNSDSEQKLRLGLKWAEKAGKGFRYFMVFDNLGWGKDGAYELSEFILRMKKL